MILVIMKWQQLFLNENVCEYNLLKMASQCFNKYPNQCSSGYI